MNLPSDLTIRNPTNGDLEALAVMLLASYRGTIDDEGENIAEAREFVLAALTEAPLLGASWLIVDRDNELVSAIMVQRWKTRPLIGFVVTAAHRKNRGLARIVAQHALSALFEMEEASVVAFVTEGNTPSERLFARLGFQRVSQN